MNAILGHTVSSMTHLPLIVALVAAQPLPATVVDGRVCLDLSVAVDALEAVETRPLLELRIQNLERRLELSQDQIFELNGLNIAAEKAAIRAWYENPYLWLSVGLVAGGALGVTLAM